ncbi:MAG: type II secretion system protein [Bifidobacterium adolescentis]
MKSVRNALNRRAKGEKGFTLVELLVVVIIIGILSAVAVPIYLNQRKAAWNSTIQSDVKNASLVVETAMTANNGKFDNGWAGTYSPGKAKLGTSDQEITVSKDVKIVIANGADSNNYTITGTNSSGSNLKTYVYSSATGKISTTK